MNYSEITDKYYSKWVGNDIKTADILLNERTIKYVYFAQRNEIPLGYSNYFDLYCFINAHQAIYSYGDKCADKIAQLQNIITPRMTIVQIAESIERTFARRVMYSVKYLYVGNRAESDAVELTEGDFDAYRRFFIENNPNCATTDWLYDYYMEMVAQKLCVGVFSDGILASCTDAPTMPHMRDEVQELGINTIARYRGRGYATRACIKCAENIVKLCKCPIWSTDAANTASQALAERAGFARYASVLTLTV